MGFKYINDEHKIRIALSQKAYSTIQDDMIIFSSSNLTNFINTIITNYRDDSIASLSIYLSKRREYYEEIFKNSELDESSKETAIQQMLKEDTNASMEQIKKYSSEKDFNKLYHINQNNFEYLTEDCNEQELFNDRPGVFIKCIIEEYCRLTFIERERIIKKKSMLW